MGPFGKKKEAPRIAGLGGDGTYPVNVVGESQYRDALIGIIKTAPADQGDKGEVRKTAFLFRDRQNAFDPNAIQVQIDGQIVGNIARDETSDISDCLQAAADAGYSNEAIGCEALIGWDSNNPQPLIGVRLDLTWERDDSE